MSLTPKQLREQETFNALIQEKNQGKDLIIHTLPSFCNYNNDLFKEAMKHCTIPQKTFCEIGCGNGEISTWLALQGAQHVFGVDVSDKAIEIARERARINHVAHQTTFIHAPGEQSTLPSHSVDTIFINVALHHLELPEALKEIHRILKQDGTLIAIEPLIRSTLAQHIRTNKIFTKLFPIRQESHDERMLTLQDIACMHTFFNTVSITSFRIFSPVLFKMKPLFHGSARLLFLKKTQEEQRKTLNHWAQTCDVYIIKAFPILERLGRYSCIVAQHPKTQA